MLLCGASNAIDLFIDASNAIVQGYTHKYLMIVGQGLCNIKVHWCATTLIFSINGYIGIEHEEADVDVSSCIVHYLILKMAHILRRGFMKHFVNNYQFVIYRSNM